MKRFYRILAALALIVSMQGCDNGPSVEPEIPETPNAEAVQLRLTGNIAAITPATRVNGSGFETNDKVGVYVSATGSLTSSGNMLNNEAFTYSSGNITAPEGKEGYWGSSETKLSVWAYYPYTESISNNAAYPFEVNADQSEAVDFYNSDFITAQAANLAPQAEAVNLTFNHSLSKISVTLEAGEGITAEELADAEKSFYISGLATSGTIDLATGTATAGEEKVQITPLASNDVNYEAIVYPQQGEVSFRLEMDGDVFIYSTQIDYAAAKQYDYTLTIDVREPQQMSLKTTTITPWGDGGETVTGTMSDIISFNDPVFKNYLLNEVIYEEREYNPNNYTTVEGGYYMWGYYTKTYYHPTTEKIDANNDGEISIAEAERVNFINVGGLDVADLSGIEYFTNLTSLNCNKGQKRMENALGESYFTYTDVTLASLDISKNTKLKALWCQWCALPSLDISQNKELLVVWCECNEFTTIDLSNNINLIAFKHYYYDTPRADFKTKGLTSIDVSKNINLVDLHIDSDELSSIDVSKNIALENLVISGNDQLSTIDVSKNTELEDLSITDCGITSLDVKANTKLTYFVCSRTQISSINLSNNTQLDNLTISGNPNITSLDLSNNTMLSYLDISSNPNIASLDLSNNTYLSIVHCQKNALSYLDVSQCERLEDLQCYDNNLTSLDLSNNTLLEWLSCSTNRLTSLDVTNNTLLQSLRCEQNLITTLDVSMNSNLDYLYCNDMDDAEGNNLLETIYIADGQNIGSLKKPNETNIVEK